MIAIESHGLRHIVSRVKSVSTQTLQVRIVGDLIQTKSKNVYFCLVANRVSRVNRKCSRPSYCEDTLVDLKRMTNGNEFEHECVQCETDLCNEEVGKVDYLVIGLAVAGGLILVGLLVGLGYLGYTLLRRIYLN